MGRVLDEPFRVRNQDGSYDRETKETFVIYPAHITVNTPNGAITIEYEGQFLQSETSIQEFFLKCLQTQNELAEIVKEQEPPHSV